MADSAPLTIREGAAKRRATARPQGAAGGGAVGGKLNLAREASQPGSARRVLRWRLLAAGLLAALAGAGLLPATAPAAVYDPEKRSTSRSCPFVPAICTSLAAEQQIARTLRSREAPSGHPPA